MNFYNEIFINQTIPFGELVVNDIPQVILDCAFYFEVSFSRRSVADVPLHHLIRPLWGRHFESYQEGNYTVW